LRQIVVNLVGNAIKFTASGEVILNVEIASGSVPRWEDPSQDLVMLSFSVKDTGIGIPAGKLQTIFEPFSQADNSTTRRHGGTGLGLTISARLVQMMNGGIHVESLEGSGSTFTFTAVFEKQSVPERPVAVDLWPQRTKALKVLVVDDNATNRRILEELLNDWHMRSTCVESGAEALAAASMARSVDDPFDLALLDLFMPEMDGFELARKMNAECGPQVPSIILLTSAIRPGDSALIRDLGIRARLLKPFKQSELFDTILGIIATLPRSGKQQDGESPVPSNAAYRILLAEDNPINQKLAVHLLRKRGHTVTVVDNGNDAVKAVMHDRFDAVLMDVQMPGMDGITATETIRRMEAGLASRTKIIAMTAHAMKGDRERCLEAGMDGYISKPIQSTELFRILDEVTGLTAEAHRKKTEIAEKPC
jgi:CheY-like chemotaxis protein